MSPTKDALSLTLVAALSWQSLGCGTILHPERRGQQSGRVDAGVVVLDAIGLLFFIIPGVIAFAVDFSNGTIYLPSESRGKNALREIRYEPGGDEAKAVEKALKTHAGLDIRLDQDSLERARLRSLDELPARFAAAARHPGFTAHARAN